MRIFGLWWGGGSYSHGDLELDLETWDSVRAAETSLVDRYSIGYRFRDNLARLVNFDEDGVATVGAVLGDMHPAITNDCHLDLYGYNRLPGRRFRIAPDPYVRLTIGPRGGVRRASF